MRIVFVFIIVFLVVVFRARAETFFERFSHLAFYLAIGLWGNTFAHAVWAAFDADRF
jgi:hypothetical protein